MLRLNRSIPFVAATLDGRVEDAADVLGDAERRHGLLLTEPPANGPEDQRDEWYERHLYPFLSDTHLIVSGGDLFGTGWGIMDDAGVDHTPTWRHWGGLLAEWANAGHWFKRPGERGRARHSQAERPWEYIDFYMADYLGAYIEGYVEWRDAVWRVLHAKYRAR